MHLKSVVFLLYLSCGTSIPQNWQNQPFSKNDDTIFIEPGVESENNVLQSSPNCPDPLFGIPFVSFEETGKCHLAGVKGPCPENMRLFPQQGSSYGFCDCNCDAYLENKYHSPRSYCTGITDFGQLRSLAFVKRWGSCQPLLEQSNCPQGDWLAFGNDPKQGPFCERAVCAAENYELKFYDKSTGRCESLDEPCRQYSSSNRGPTSFEGTYQLKDVDWVPVCVPGTEESTNQRSPARPPADKGSGIVPLNCPRGSQYSRITGKCQRRTYVGRGVG